MRCPCRVLNTYTAAQACLHKGGKAARTAATESEPARMPAHRLGHRGCRSRLGGESTACYICTYIHRRECAGGAAAEGTCWNASSQGAALPSLESTDTQVFHAM